MKNIQYLLFTTLLLLPLSPNFVHGQTIVQHLGANDPLTEGFEVAADGHATLSPVFDDHGRDAWRIDDSVSTSPTRYHAQLSPENEAAAMIQGWKLSASMRFVEPNTVSRLAYTTGDSTFDLAFSLDGNGDIIVSRSRVPLLYTLEGGGTDYHEFALVYDPVEATAALWIDGELRLTDFQAITPASLPNLVFGSAGRHNLTHWNDVTFTIIPEPATVAFLSGLGALIVVAGVRLRRRKLNQ